MRRRDAPSRACATATTASSSPARSISQTGSWMQRIALGWFVFQLTHDPFAVGIMALAQFLPFTLFGLFAGVHHRPPRRAPPRDRDAGRRSS